MHTEITVEVEGDANRIDARTLLDVARSMLDLLESVGERPNYGSVWVPTGLVVGSLCLDLVCSEPDAADVVDTVMNGISSLDHSVVLPDGFRDRDLRSLVDMARTAHKGGGNGVKVVAGDTKREITDRVAQNAEAARSIKVQSWGSVSGVLDRLILRNNRNEVGLIDDVTKRAVTVRFPERLRDRVVGSMAKRVVGVGRLTRDLSGEKLTLELYELELDEKQPPEPISQLVGVLGDDWTGGLDAVEFVRGNRRD